MITLSENTTNMLKDYAISWKFNSDANKFELHFPSDNFEFLETEKEIIESINDYIDFWKSL